MSVRPSSSLQSYKKQYRIGSSLASTKAEIKQSEKHIGCNRSAAKAVEREGSSAKLSFYKDLQRLNGRYQSGPSLAPAKDRPFSQYSHQALQPRKRQGKTAEELLFDESGLCSKPANLNLPGHFKRALGGFHGRAVARPATGLAATSSAHTQSQQPAISNKVTEARSESEQNLTLKSGALAQAAPEDLEARPPREPNSGDADVLRERFERNPKGVLEDELYELERFGKLLGAANESQEKERQKLIDEQLRLTNMGRFVGQYADFEPILPGEQFSLYMQGEPEFNREGHKLDFKREPVLKVKPEDEEEVRALMAEAYERYAFYLKYTDVQYDHEYKLLKGSQVRLTRIEMEKVRREYRQKSGR